MKIVFFLFVFLNISFGQKLNSKNHIQKIEILDKNLVKYLKVYIDENKKKNHLFNSGFGYLVIEKVNPNFNSGRPIETQGQLSAFNILLNLNIKAVQLDTEIRYDCVECNYFPPFYSEIDDKIILIYDDVFSGLMGRSANNDLKNTNIFSNISKKKLVKCIKKSIRVDLEDDFVIKNAFEPNLTIGELKKKSKSKNEIFNKYEFIYFNSEVKIGRNIMGVWSPL